MNRRCFLKRSTLDSLLAVSSSQWMLCSDLFGAVSSQEKPSIPPATANDWLVRWEKNILKNSANRYCDREMGEELGWHVSPFLNGFYYGYLATGNARWVEIFVDWTDSCLKRSLREPDGFPGWPKGDGGGNESNEFNADSLLGEAMMLRPVVLMADVILKNPALEKSWGIQARRYQELAHDVFQKWESRDCWRETKNGGLWVVPPFGIDLKTGKWSAGYDTRKTAGMSNPANKQNHIANWLLAMSDVTRKPVYLQRCEKWFAEMKSRMRTRENGNYFVWNYWDPAQPGDYKADGSPRHWVGVHPNGGYYGIDVEGMVAAYAHGLVFKKEDIHRLIATNRDFMWNQKLDGAAFQRIDGRPSDPRWKNSPGVLWSSLVPYDAVLREIFIASHRPESWGGLASTPWFLSLPKT